MALFDVLNNVDTSQQQQQQQYGFAPVFSGDHAGADQRAWLARSQWADYQRRFQPVEDQLIDAVTGTEMLDKRLSAISVNNKSAFDAAAQNTAMTRQRYGINPSQQQQASLSNMDAIAATRADADARNNIRTATYDRNMAAIAGGSSSARTAIDGSGA
jgi:hypothetical protein